MEPLTMLDELHCQIGFMCDIEPAMPVERESS